MSRMSELIPVKRSNVPASPSNPYLEAASEAGGELGRLLKFVKGEWQTGDDTLLEGAEFVARIDLAARGWVRFAGGKVTDQIVGKIADGFRPPARDELADNDPASWIEKDANGRPRDPWVEQWYLPLVGFESRELLTFVTGSKGGRAAIGGLCLIYGNTKRDRGLPVVALRTRSYKHKQYGRIETPELAIVGWEGGAPAATTAIPTPTGNAAAAELDDAIPF